MEVRVGVLALRVQPVRVLGLREAFKNSLGSMEVRLRMKEDS